MSTSSDGSPLDLLPLRFAFAATAAYDGRMRSPIGVGLGLLALVTIVGCGQTTSRNSDPVPPATLAPVSSVSGVIEDQGGKFGVITFSLVTFTIDDGTFVELREPSVAFDIGPTGAFSVALPSNVVGFDDELRYGTCDFGGHAVIGLLLVFDEQPTDPIPYSLLDGWYQQVAGDAKVAYWYSPEDTRVTCEWNEEIGSGIAGGLYEDWDLRLVRGWNTVLAYMTEEQAWFRTGVVSGSEWRPGE